jgi:predicted nucleotidyltransferase component of viral defense system
VSGAPLARQATFGGGTALSAVYLHHRFSEDLDFFLPREASPVEVRALSRALRQAGFSTEARPQPMRQSLVLVSGRREVGHIDLAHFPYDPIGRPTLWQGLRVDSLLDMAVNKVQAILTRARERDFVDLYFLLNEGPEQDIERLLDLARAKFDVGASRITLAEQLLRVEEVVELPRMRRPLSLATLRRALVEQARLLIRKGAE